MDAREIANPEAEESVIGSLLIDPACKYAVEQIVSPSDFYDERLRELAIHAFSMDGDLDYLTLLDRSKRQDWAGFIASLIARVPTSVHAEHYARIVKRDSVRRQTVKTAGLLAATAYSCDAADEEVGYANRKVSELSAEEGGPVGAKAVASSLYDRVEEWSRKPLGRGEVRGLDTGFPSLNDRTGGLRPGELTIVCGRPGMGKSSLTFEICRRVVEAGKGVLIFSLEMTKEAVFSRWASAMSGTESRAVQRGTGDLAKYMHALGKLASLDNLWIDDAPALTPSQVSARAFRMGRENGLDLVAVDHGRKMKSEHRGNEFKAEGAKTAAMKDLSKELRVPLLLVLQLNRGPEHAASKVPTMSSLRDSGEHEEEADNIVAIRREDYYDPDAEGGTLDLYLLKQREGPSGTKKLSLGYDPSIQRFTDGVRRIVL